MGWGLVVERLVGSAGVVVVDPGSEFESGVFDGGEAVAPAKLFLEGLDEALAEAVLLRSVGGDVFLLEAVVLDDGAVLARAEDQTVVVAQEHAGRCASEGAEASEGRFLQGAFCGFGPSGQLQCMPEDLTGAAVDDGHEDAPAVLSAVDESKVGGPSLIGMIGDGAGDTDPRSGSSLSLWKGPASELHDAVDLLAVDGEALDEAQPAPGAAHAAGRLLFVELLDASGEGLIDGTGVGFARLIVGGGSWEVEPVAYLGNGGLMTRRAQGLVDMSHESASG